MTHRITTVAILFLTACAGTWQQQATRYGMVAKEIVDTGARAVAVHVRDMEERCDSQVELEDYQACLGPVAGQPDATMAVFESVRAAQLALYVAVAAGDHLAALAALDELRKRLAIAAELVRKAKEAR